MQHYFRVDLATKLWIEKAILLHNIIYRWQKDVANKQNNYELRHWVYNSANAFWKIFPYMSWKSISRRLKELVEEWYLMQWCFNKNKFDKTNWYSPTEKSLSYYGLSMDQNEESVDQNEEWVDQNEETIPNIITNIITKREIRVSKDTLTDGSFSENNFSSENFSVHTTPQVPPPPRNDKLIEYTPSQITKDINNIINIAKSSCKKSWIAYSPVKERIYAKHILWNKFWYNVSEVYDWTIENFIHDIILLSANTKYCKIINSLQSLFYNWQDVYNRAKQNNTVLDKSKEVVYL